MSSSEPYTINCPKCGEAQSFMVWKSVNVTVDPQLKPLLLNGELNESNCPHCGHVSKVSYDCLYHDMDRQVAIWLKHPDAAGNSEVDAESVRLFAMLGPGFVCRRVTSLNDLLEKICVIDDGYTDLEMEIAKLLLSMRNKIDLAASLYYDRTERDLPTATEIVLVQLGEDGVREWRAPVTLLRSAREIAEKLSLNASTGWPKVDRLYVLELMKQAGLATSVG